MKEEKYFFKCTNCGKEYHNTNFMYLCPDCAKNNTQDKPPEGVLSVIYNYKKLKSLYKKEKLFDKLRKNEYVKLLPIQSERSLSYLKVGKTPLYRIGKIKNINLPFELYLKDDSQNPTFSFKDRASELVSAYAKENGIDTIVAASTGNAGSSLAGICASQNQRAIIFVPASAPLAKLTQILMYGAQLVPIDGSYDDAFDISIQATEHFGWFNRNTAYNPFTIEGKKTVSYELYRQLNWQAPDRVFVPVGDGVIISGVYKGFYDLLQLGIIDKMPQVIAVQSQGSSNIVDNLDREDFAYEKSDTIADSIAVDIPRNFHMAKKYLKKYNGEGIKVSDEDILTASKILSENTGIFSEPAASAAFAGFLSYFNNGKIEENTKNVVLLTGSGLKDLNAVQKIITMPPKIKPVFEELQKFYDSFIKNQ